VSLSSSSTLCILCKAWIYFSVSSSGTVVLKSNRLARLKSLRFSTYQKKRGWRGTDPAVQGEVGVETSYLKEYLHPHWAACIYFFWAKTCPFCSGKILKLKVNPTLLWAGLTTMEAWDQNPGGGIQLEKVVLVSPIISTWRLFSYPLCSPTPRWMGGVEESPLI